MKKRDTNSAPKLKIGDKVVWTSQASGSAKAKSGQVVAIVEPGRNPHFQFYTKLYDAKNAWGGGWARQEYSYLILVPGKTPASKPCLYWPRTKCLVKTGHSKKGLKHAVPGGR